MAIKGQFFQKKENYRAVYTLSFQNVYFAFSGMEEFFFTELENRRFICLNYLKKN